MALAVAEYQVEVSVLVQIELVDALKHTGAGDIQILSGIAEGALSKVFESLCFPGFFSHNGPRCLLY